MTALPDRPLSRIIRPAEAEAWTDGFAFLALARAEAATIRATANDEIARARAAGHAEGRRAGEAEATALLLQVQADIDAYLSGIEPRLADLVIAITRQLLDGMDDAQRIAALTRRALTEFRETESVILSVPQNMVAAVEAELGSTPNLRIAPDRHLTGHQCMLTSPASSVDIGTDAQIGAIRSAMAQ